MGTEYSSLNDQAPCNQKHKQTDQRQRRKQSFVSSKNNHESRKCKDHKVKPPSVLKSRPFKNPQLIFIQSSSVNFHRKHREYKNYNGNYEQINHFPISCWCKVNITEKSRKCHLKMQKFKLLSPFLRFDNMRLILYYSFGL